MARAPPPGPSSTCSWPCCASTRGDRDICALCASGFRAGVANKKQELDRRAHSSGLALGAPCSSWAHANCNGKIRARISAAAALALTEPPSPPAGPSRRSQGAPPPPRAVHQFRANGYQGGWRGAEADADDDQEGARPTAGGGVCTRALRRPELSRRADRSRSPRRDDDEARQRPDRRSRSRSPSPPPDGGRSGLSRDQAEGGCCEGAEPHAELQSGSSGVLETCPRAHVLGGMATAEIWHERRDGRAPARVPLTADRRTAVGSTCNWRHLDADERTLRGKNELNILGDSIFFPFGGGEKREQAGEPVGVRAASYRGMALTNLRAMLECADVLAALRTGNRDVVFETLNLKVFNTDHVEHAFALLCRLCGFYKGELQQCIQQFRRADHLESVTYDETRNFEMGAKRARGSKYADVAHARTEKAHVHNNGSAVDPRSAGRTEYEESNRAEALKAATAEDELVRSRFADRGIGKAAV